MLSKLLLAIAVAAPLLQAQVAPASAADFGAQPQPPASIASRSPVGAIPADPAAALEHHLARHAVLLMIRASFDVLPRDEVFDELAAEARRLGVNGPGEYDLARLDRDLLAEGSYYLVSLRYLAALGGAIWPAGRPERLYVNDTLVRLEALQEQLIEAVATRADPLPILQEAQAIHGLTEGLTEITPPLDYFGGRDELVEQVLADHGPRTST